MASKLHREQTRAVVEALGDEDQKLVDAIVADGWPEPMATAGLQMHRWTWDVDQLAESIQRELAGVWNSSRHRIAWPKKVHHIWPSLPGAGMTPVLVGMLLGLRQAIRPSTRGLHFARQVSECTGLELLDPTGTWDDADLVVVSGSDETVEAVRRQMGSTGRVVGYGHRVSFSVVDDVSEAADLEELAEAVARDVVMWHQRGCFSTRAVLFTGSQGRMLDFSAALAAQIALLEKRWEADDIEPSAAARRAQSLGVAEMTGEVFCEGIGYVRPATSPFDGSKEAIHSLTVHRIDGPTGLGDAAAVAPEALQAVALGGRWRQRGDEWVDAVADLGATRVCEAGRLQAPPADWWHDGIANALSWGRVVTLE